MKLRTELKLISKGSRTICEYLKQIKTIVNALISIGDPISHRAHMEVLFDGLPSDYSELVTVIYNRDTPCSVAHAESMIIAHEARLDRV